jgi:hypothetical protein
MRLVKSLILITLAILISGCALFSKEDTSSASGILQTQANLKFQDIPVPAGFKLLPQDSYSFENSGVRVGVLRYQGKASLEQVLSFYKEQMPMHNWNLLNVMEYGDCIMNFERETESCIVNIASKGSGSIISISLGPKSQGGHKKSRPVLK